jgi:Wnt-binding factor required for Wnt secretion
MPTTEAKLLTLRVDEMNRQKNWLCGGCVCLLITAVYLLVSLTMPALFKAIEPTDCDQLGLEQRKGRFCVYFPLNGPPIFQTYVMGIDSFNQYLHIRAVPLKAKSDRKLLINKNISFNVVIEEVTDDFLVTRQAHLLQNQTAPVTCDFTDLSTEACSKFTLVLKPQIDPGNYRISFSLQKLDELRSFVSAMELEGVGIDSEYYTRYVALRYVFFFVSVLLMLAYVYRFLRTPDRLKVFEQYYMVVLAFALCLFNDPLLYLNVLKPSKYSLLISTLCNVSYIAVLFLFWAVLFPRISLENEVPRTMQLQLWKVVYMGVNLGH